VDLQRIVNGEPDLAEKMFNTKFIVGWMLTVPILGADCADEFGMYMAGSEL
jgi:hypothetical protein